MKAYTILRHRAGAPVLLTCEHASPRIPLRYGTLGLRRAQLPHVSDWYDIGAAAVTRLLSTHLRATAVLATHSRLVVDLARFPDDPFYVRPHSRGTPIPGNKGITRRERRERVRRYHKPYHDRVRAELRRLSQHQHVLLIDIHSFNHVLNGERRDTDIGILFAHDRARPLCRKLRTSLASSGLRIDYNKPYSAKETAGQMLKMHDEPRVQGIEFEINDRLLQTMAGIQRIAVLLGASISPLLSPS